MLFKLSYLNSNFELTLSYLNPALNNPAPLIGLLRWTCWHFICLLSQPAKTAVSPRSSSLASFCPSLIYWRGARSWDGCSSQTTSVSHPWSQCWLQYWVVSPQVRESGFRNKGHFSWWNPESKFLWQRIRNPQRWIQNPRLSWGEFSAEDWYSLRRMAVLASQGARAEKPRIRY